MMAAPKPEGSRRTPFPSRNPLPLSSGQETQVRELYYKNVRSKCANEIRGIISLNLHTASMQSFDHENTDLFHQTSQPVPPIAPSPRPGHADRNDWP